MCYCGDLYCCSCGPAQGNSKCPNCELWTLDGGCDDPEFCNEENRKMDDAEAEALAWAEQVANEYFGGNK